MTLSEWWKNGITSEERDFLADNYTIYSSNGPITPLREGKRIDDLFDELGYLFLGGLLTTGCKLSGSLVKNESVCFRSIMETLSSPVAKHFYYQSEIQSFYKWRESGFLEDAIDACKKQIALGPLAIHDFMLNGSMRSGDIQRWTKIADELKPLTKGNDNIARLMQEKYQDALQQIERAKQGPLVDASRFLGPEHVGYKQLCIILEKQGNYDEAITLARQAMEEHWNGDWDKRIEKLKKKIEKK